MHVEAVNATAGSLLASVRPVLSDADEALLCVAFAQARYSETGDMDVETDGREEALA